MITCTRVWNRRKTEAAEGAPVANNITRPRTTNSSKILIFESRSKRTDNSATSKTSDAHSTANSTTGIPILWDPLKFSKISIILKLAFQVNIWLEDSSRTPGTDQASLTFGYPFVFAVLEKAAPDVSVTGCFLYQQSWVPNVAPLMTDDGLPDAVRSINFKARGAESFFGIFHQDIGEEGK